MSTLKDAVRQGQTTVVWTYERLNGLKLHEPKKRQHLAAGALITAIEHGAGITAPVADEIYRSAAGRNWRPTSGASGWLTPRLRPMSIARDEANSRWSMR